MFLILIGLFLFKEERYVKLCLKNIVLIYFCLDIIKFNFYEQLGNGIENFQSKKGLRFLIFVFRVYVILSSKYINFVYDDSMVILFVLEMCKILIFVDSFLLKERQSTNELDIVSVNFVIFNDVGKVFIFGQGDFEGDLFFSVNMMVSFDYFLIDFMQFILLCFLIYDSSSLVL